MQKSKVAIVEALITDSKGRILLLKRSNKNKIYVNKWQLPGGKVEFGEDIKKAIKREIKEETGRIAIKPRLERVLSVREKYKNRHNDIMLLVYAAKIKGKVILSPDHSEYKYISVKDIVPSSLMKISRKSLFSKNS